MALHGLNKEVDVGYAQTLSQLLFKSNLLKTDNYLYYLLWWHIIN